MNAGPKPWIIPRANGIEDKTVEDLLDIDEVWYINLDRRVDRLTHIKKELLKAPFRSVHRFPAIDSASLKRQEIERQVHGRAILPVLSNQREYHEELGLGALGCYLSHLRLWEHSRQSRKRILILEDDAVFPKDFFHQLQQRRLQLPNKYDVLLLYCKFNDKPQPISPGIVKPHSFFGMVAYIITPQFVDKAYHLMTPIRYQIDGAMSFLTPMFDIYAVDPNLVGIIDSYSDTQTSNSVHKFMYIESRNSWIVPLVILFLIFLVAAIWYRNSLH